ncbi:MAG: hypothetical protein AB8B50_15555 [Pirellulaceae bacterium]
MSPIIRQRDFVEDDRGWLYAVVLPVESRHSSDALVVSLRYRRDLRGVLRKIDTAAAERLLSREGGGLVQFVEALGCEVAMLPRSQVRQHYSARERMTRLSSVILADSELTPLEVDRKKSTEGFGEVALEEKAARVVRMFIERGMSTDDFGITGSMLVNAHRASSDLDFVFYSQEAFAVARTLARESLNSPTDQRHWRDAYEKRCPSLGFDEFLWHEQRKANKFWLAGTKVDLSLSRIRNGCRLPVNCRKLQEVVVRAVVTEDQFAFDTPASWLIDCEEAERLLCWTATYTAQAVVGEEVEIAGCLEETESGRQVVVGSSREAEGEYIRVLKPAR